MEGRSCTTNQMSCTTRLSDDETRLDREETEFYGPQALVAVQALKWKAGAEIPPFVASPMPPCLDTLPPALGAPHN